MPEKIRQRASDQETLFGNDVLLALWFDRMDWYHLRLRHTSISVGAKLPRTFLFKIDFELFSLDNGRFTVSYVFFLVLNF